MSLPRHVMGRPSALYQPLTQIHGTSASPFLQEELYPRKPKRYFGTQTETAPCCIICCQDFTDPVACTLCRHCYCRECVEDLLSGQCLRCGNMKFDATTDPLLEQIHTQTCSKCLWCGPATLFSGHPCIFPEQSSRLLDLALPSHPSPQFSANAPSPSGSPETRSVGVRSVRGAGARESSRGNTSIAEGSPQRICAVGIGPGGNLRTVQLSECIDAVKRNPLNPQGWFHLGRCLKRDEEVVVTGTAVNRIGCLTTALHLDPTNEYCWRALGHALRPGQQACVRGDPYSRRDCMVQSLLRDESSAVDWTLLGTTLGPGEVLLLPATNKRAWPMSVSALECFRRALTYDNRNAAAYAYLADRLVEGQQYRVNGEALTRTSAALYSLALDSTQSVAWRALADAIEVGEQVPLHDGTLVGREDCLAMAQTFSESEDEALRLMALSPQRYR